jgi:hypothetical protein
VQKLRRLIDRSRHQPSYFKDDTEKNEAIAFYRAMYAPPSPH